MHITRRQFIGKSALATAGSTLIPGFLKAFESQTLGRKNELGEKILVVIQLSGGNDGLNTMVPYRNDIYYKGRPTIAIPVNKVLPLHDELGFNPALAPLRPLFDDGLMTVVNSVGYPNPDRSHFRSMDIWQTASDADQYLTTGWLGRYLDAACEKTCLQPYDAVEIDGSLSLALKGEKIKGLAMQHPQKFYQSTRSGNLQRVAMQTESHAHQAASYLYKTLSETISSAAYIYDRSHIFKSKAPYPDTELGGKLKTVAAWILSGGRTNVYYLSLSGFDTHVGQNGQQNRLLGQYAESVKVFVDDLKQRNRLDDVLVMTFSEFGRRVNQNGSNGTDHGTANNLFLFGGKLKKPGFYNGAPDLASLNDGDLQYQIDFRSIYATVLKQWLNTADEAVMGHRYEYLDIV